MRIENANASDVLERILSAYGFTMQKELAERLGIAKSNVAGWLQRGQIPGNVIVQCALDTGADVNWIVIGELANANNGRGALALKGRALYEKIISNGGRTVLRRILDAYGFTTQKQLCDLLDISSGTVSTWIRRGYFPGDIVVTCALETGVSLEWLTLGTYENASLSSDQGNCTKIETKQLLSGKLVDEPYSYLSDGLLPPEVNEKSLLMIKTKKNTYLVDRNENSISNGNCLLDIDGNLDFYIVSRRPGKKIYLTSMDGNAFECEMNEVAFCGKVLLTLTNWA